MYSNNVCKHQTGDPGRVYMYICGPRLPSGQRPGCPEKDQYHRMEGHGKECLSRIIKGTTPHVGHSPWALRCGQEI